MVCLPGIQGESPSNCTGCRENIVLLANNLKMLEIKEKVEIESSVKLNQILTTMYSSVPDVVERTHLVIACAREGALCLLHFVGRG